MIRKFGDRVKKVIVDDKLIPINEQLVELDIDYIFKLEIINDDLERLLKTEKNEKKLFQLQKLKNYLDSKKLIVKVKQFIIEDYSILIYFMNKMHKTLIDIYNSNNNIIKMTYIEQFILWLIRLIEIDNRELVVDNICIEILEMKEKEEFKQRHKRFIRRVIFKKNILYNIPMKSLKFEQYKMIVREFYYDKLFQLFKTLKLVDLIEIANLLCKYNNILDNMKSKYPLPILKTKDQPFQINNMSTYNRMLTELFPNQDITKLSKNKRDYYMYTKNYNDLSIAKHTEKMMDKTKRKKGK